MIFIAQDYQKPVNINLDRIVTRNEFNEFKKNIKIGTDTRVQEKIQQIEEQLTHKLDQKDVNPVNNLINTFNGQINDI